MATLIVSDLHLGAASGRDILRGDAGLPALLTSLDGIDHLVLLGDVVELRERPAREPIAAARPVLAALDGAMAGRRVTLVAGNHDHQLARPLVERARIEGGALGLEAFAEPPRDGPLGAVARAFGRSDLRVAYPGLWVRPDVYATHGHYLDVHNTVPSLERLAIGAVQRLTARLPAGRAAPEDYEAIVAPVYDVAYALAQSSAGGRGHVPQDRSARVWRAVAGEGRRTLAARLVGGVALPAAVRTLNAAGLGPLSADLSGPELRRAALRGMTAVLEHLGVRARHVVFGHTHRSGPHPGDAGWGPLVNAGSWLLEPMFLGARPTDSPYWPGHCVRVPDDGGPPRLERLVTALPGVSGS